MPQLNCNCIVAFTDGTQRVEHVTFPKGKSMAGTTMEEFIAAMLSEETEARRITDFVFVLSERGAPAKVAIIKSAELELIGLLRDTILELTPTSSKPN